MRGRANGAEFELSGRVTDHWNLSGTLGILRAKYDKFFTDLLGTGTPSDYSYLPLRRAPHTTASVQSIYDVPLPVGNLSLFVGYNWTSDYADTINDQPGTHIQSFGILALNANSSSPATDWAGWSDHFLNGIGFGIAYAMVALGRRWAWGILWGCTLETLTLLTPSRWRKPS